jgi:hypothetical protein
MYGLQDVEHSIIAIKPDVSAAFITTNTCAIDGNYTAFGPTFHIQLNINQVTPCRSWYKIHTISLIKGRQ